jgi:hypothetical protein
MLLEGHKNEPSVYVGVTKLVALENRQKLLFKTKLRMFLRLRENKKLLKFLSNEKLHNLSSSK